MAKPWAISARVSIRRQADDGLSFDAQHVNATQLSTEKEEDK